MASNLNIYKKCYHCNGTGKVLISIDGEEQEGDEDCPICEGTGEIYWGRMEKEKDE